MGTRRTAPNIRGLTFVVDIVDIERDFFEGRVFEMKGGDLVVADGVGEGLDAVQVLVVDGQVESGVAEPIAQVRSRPAQDEQPRQLRLITQYREVQSSLKTNRKHAQN